MTKDLAYTIIGILSVGIGGLGAGTWLMWRRVGSDKTLQNTFNEQVKAIQEVAEAHEGIAEQESARAREAYEQSARERKEWAEERKQFILEIERIATERNEHASAVGALRAQVDSLGEQVESLKKLCEAQSEKIDKLVTENIELRGVIRQMTDALNASNAMQGVRK